MKCDLVEKYGYEIRCGCNFIIGLCIESIQETCTRKEDWCQDNTDKPIAEIGFGNSYSC